MATTAHKFRVGAFVLSALVIGVAGLIWLGATRLFERSVHLVTYFSESVQGLEPGAAVKYRGVPSGRVEEIRVAPDGDLIEVLMSIDPTIAELAEKDESLRAQLQLTGITGLRYIEIDRHGAASLDRYPALNFSPPFPLIRSTPSTVTAIQDALGEIYKRIMAVDLAGISADMRNALQATDVLLRDERIYVILDNLEAVSQSAIRLGNNLEGSTTDLELKPAVQNLTEATEEARALFAELRAGNVGVRLEEALVQMDRLAMTAQQFVITLQQTTERLDRTIGNLERVTEDVRLQPSRLLFSDPPPPRRPGDGKNE